MSLVQIDNCESIKNLQKETIKLDENDRMTEKKLSECDRRLTKSIEQNH
jgi:hypothetical protein